MGRHVNQLTVCSFDARISASCWKSSNRAFGDAFPPPCPAAKPFHSRTDEMKLGRMAPIAAMALLLAGKAGAQTYDASTGASPLTLLAAPADGVAYFETKTRARELFRGQRYAEAEPLLQQLAREYPRAPHSTPSTASSTRAAPPRSSRSGDDGRVWLSTAPKRNCLVSHGVNGVNGVDVAVDSVDSV
jgi:hypothetical protein